MNCIVTIPRICPRGFPLLSARAPHSRQRTHFFRTLLSRIGGQGATRLPIILVTRLSVRNDSHDKRSRDVNKVRCIPLDTVKRKCSCLTLKRVRYPRSVGNDRRRTHCYNAPLPIDFSRACPRSISVVRLRGKTRPRVDAERVRGPVPLIALPRSPAPFRSTLGLLRRCPRRGPTCLHLGILAGNCLPPSYGRGTSGTTGNGTYGCYCVGAAQRQRTSASRDGPVSVRRVRRVSPLRVTELCCHRARKRRVSPRLYRLVRAIVRGIGDGGGSWSFIQGVGLRGLAVGGLTSVRSTIVSFRGKPLDRRSLFLVYNRANTKGAAVLSTVYLTLCGRAPHVSRTRGRGCGSLDRAFSTGGRSITVGSDQRLVHHGADRT